MMRILVITVVVCCLIPRVAHADMQYWVSISSYKDQQRAEKASAEVTGKIDDKISVIGVETSKGYFYRVVSGPYLTRVLAEDRVREARSRGFASAWLWPDESDLANTRYDDSSYTFDFDTDSIDYSSDLDLDLDLELDLDLRYLDEDATAGEIEMREQREDTPVMVDEPPPGYQLNKLRRDA